MFFQIKLTCSLSNLDCINQEHSKGETPGLKRKTIISAIMFQFALLVISAEVHPGFFRVKLIFRLSNICLCFAFNVKNRGSLCTFSK